MGPVLPQAAVAFEQGFQRSGPVALAPGKQDHVMGPFDRGDAVDLDKADAPDQCGKLCTGRGPCWGFGQGVPVQKQAPRERVQKNGHGHALGLPCCGPQASRHARAAFRNVALLRL